MTASTSTPRAVRVVDVVVGAVIAAFGLVVGAGMLLFISSLSSGAEACADGGCDATGLTVAVIGGSAVIVFGWAITFGLYLVRAIRRRVAFFLPLIGLVVMVAGAYAAAAGAGAWVQQSGLVP